MNPPKTIATNSTDTRDLLNNLISKHWLPAEFQVTLTQIDEPASFEGLLGINTRSVYDNFAPNYPFAIICEHHLATNRNYQLIDETIIISKGEISRQSNLELFFIILLLLHHLKTLASSCNCIIGNQQWQSGTFDISNLTVPCPDCQKNLNSSGNGLECLSFICALTLLKRNYNSILTNLGEITRAITIDDLTSELLTTKANTIIDYIANPGSSVCNWLSKTSKAVNRRKKKIMNAYSSKNLKNHITFIAARRWNSWTPSQPSNRQKPSSLAVGSDFLKKKTGGGYIVSDGKTRIAVDPGYGFLEMIYRWYGITVKDIDAIVITHDHPDHSNELSNILALRYVYRDTLNPLRLLLNGSTYVLYSAMCTYHSEIIYNNEPTLINEFTDIMIDDIRLQTTAVIHHEICDTIPVAQKNALFSSIGPSKALALKFTGTSDDGISFSFGILGDTSFPTDARTLETWKEFFRDTEIISFHLGSLEKGWERHHPRPSEITYGNGKHLGLNGLIKSLTLLTPPIAIITEFGEELDQGNERLSLVEIAKECLIGTKISIIPSDVSLELIKNTNGDILCKCVCGKYIPAKLARCSVSAGFITYDFFPGCASGLSHLDLL